MAFENSTLTIDKERLLEEYNDDMARKMIPAMAYLVIMMIFGIIGNTGVSYFYGWKARRSPGSLFILTLSVYDLLLCIFSVPIEILDIRFFYTFNNSGACKFMRFINYFASAGSIFTLQVIAVDRYRRICIPFKSQIGKRGAKIACGLSIVAGVFFSWAAFLFFNAEPVDVVTDDGVLLQGHDCTTLRDKAYKIYIWIGICFYGLSLITSAVILFVMYGLVGKTLYRHVQKSKHLHVNTPVSEFHCNGQEKQDSYQNTEEQTEKATHIKLNKKTQVTQTKKSQPEENISVTSIRFTYMMLAISVVFFLSFVPYIAFSVWRGTLKEYEGDDFTTEEQIGINIGIRSFFINSAINPFIYGFFNPKFRKLCYAKMCSCFQKPLNETPDNSLNGSGTQTSKV